MWMAASQNEKEIDFYSKGVLEEDEVSSVCVFVCVCVCVRARARACVCVVSFLWSAGMSFIPCVGVRAQLIERCFAWLCIKKHVVVSIRRKI